ncbi:MAG: CPBP family intramembrane metalloprotease [Propionibacteriaceae bacterium]|jgi:membrane protease YdiL (CAAX protease family)|nr:CPBP family intramembrane metalloprotease [Propionibacteriaceae bacterium]
MREMTAVKKPLKHVVIFLVLTFIQTWLSYAAIIIFKLDAVGGLGMAFLICGGMAPSLIGVIMALITYDKDARKEYFRRFYQVRRISVFWWLFILLAFPAIHAVTALITLAYGGEMPTAHLLQSIIQNPASLLPVLLVGFFVNGAWPEEWGWRGFALQPLLDRFGFVKANLLLGSIWAVWHLPLFFMPAMGHYQMGFTGFWFFVAQSIGLSMIMAFVHLKTKQSILAAMLLHMFYNLTFNLAANFSGAYERIVYSLTLIAGVAIGVYISSRRQAEA